MAEFEFPGVFVEEAGGNPKPIDGVPTNFAEALSAAAVTRWIYGIVIGAAILAGMGFWLVTIRGDVIFQLLVTPAGFAGFAVVFVSAFVLEVWRSLVEWRRRRAGRPPLRYGKLAFGVTVFQLANLVAFALYLVAVAVSLLVARAYTWDLVAAGINVLVGCFWVFFAGSVLRDLLLLVQAAHDDR